MKLNRVVKIGCKWMRNICKMLNDLSHQKCKLNLLWHFILTHSEWQRLKNKTTTTKPLTTYAGMLVVKTDINSLLLCKLIQPQWKSGWSIPQRLELDLQWDPATPHVNMHPKEQRLYCRVTSTLLYSQQAGNRNSLDAHQLMNDVQDRTCTQ